jgi:hypothetical protein
MPGPKLLLAILVLSFFGSLIVAAIVFPAGYDWRHTVMSSLASPRENPRAFRIVSYGMALSGVLLAFAAFHVRRSLQPCAPNWTAWARGFFVAGGVLLTVSALITPGHHAFLGLPKAHAKIAQAAGVGFALGMILNLPAILVTPARRYHAREAALILICVPLTVFLTCWVLLPTLEAWASTSPQQETKVSALGSLAFWEWVGSISVYLFVALVILAWKEKKSVPTNRPRGE